MKKKFLIQSFLIGISLIMMSCSNKDKILDRTSSKLPLRQMINDKENKTSSSGWFFVIAGGYSSESEENNYIKCLAKADGCYYFMKINLSDVRIKINNKIKNPYLLIDYNGSKYSDQHLILNDYLTDSYTIVCPEKYLPKNLTPIKI